MRKSEGGLWTATLFAANEIPSVVVTFVAMIIFLQMKMGVALSTLFASVLLLPWVMQPFVRRALPSRGGIRIYIHLIELLLTISLGVFALTMNAGKWWTLGMLMVISLLSTWHDLLARRYYKCRVMCSNDNIHSTIRTLSSQTATVFTYGLMIMVVGVLQIYFRQRSVLYSWSLATYVLAGGYMLLFLVNLLLLKGTSNKYQPTPYITPWKRPRWLKQLFVLSLMLLPQGLMFYSRTAFLLARPQDGGLGCTLQDVGFAHGTIGVIAYLLGVALGRYLQQGLSHAGVSKVLKLCLGLSPVVYLIMTYHRPDNVFILSMYTFMAQLLFGLGLNACSRYIEDISGERYQKAINPLYIPVISLSIVLPMVASGFMLDVMSYRDFFMFDALCAILAWGLIWIIRIKE